MVPLGAWVLRAATRFASALKRSDVRVAVNLSARQFLQADLVENMADEKVADLLEEMEPDEAADLLAELPEKRSRGLLALMNKEESDDVEVEDEEVEEDEEP